MKLMIFITQGKMIIILKEKDLIYYLRNIYIGQKKLSEILDKRVVIEFNSFTSGEKNSSIYLNIKPGIDFSIAKFKGKYSQRVLNPQNTS